MSHVFLTGATGAIGSVLVPRLLADAGTSVSLLIRAKDDIDLRRRLREMMNYWGMLPRDSRADRVRALRGDISLPDFGLGFEELARLDCEVTHMVHCAASVKLNMTLDQARATAVVPTRTVLALGRRFAVSGKLRKIDLISTVGVWGCTPGLMPERPLPEVCRFHNTYEAAKAEAERVAWDEGGDLPVTMHRPSMVVGDSGTGQAIQFQVFYHLCEFLSGSRTFGIMPSLGHTRLDTIPVDWVADVVLWASRHEETAGEVFHLCSGPDQSIELVELQEIVRQSWQTAGRSVPQLHTVGRQWLERLVPLIGLFAGPRNRRALRGLSPVLAYLSEDQGFENRRTAARLAAAGLSVPRIQDYVTPVLNYYLQQLNAKRSQ